MKRIMKTLLNINDRDFMKVYNNTIKELTEIHYIVLRLLKNDVYVYFDSYVIYNKNIGKYIMKVLDDNDIEYDVDKMYGKIMIKNGGTLIPENIEKIKSDGPYRYRVSIRDEFYYILSDNEYKDLDNSLQIRGNKRINE